MNNEMIVKLPKQVDDIDAKFQEHVRNHPSGDTGELEYIVYWGNGIDTNIDIDTGIVENYLIVNPTNYEITNNTLTVHFTTNVTVKEAKINTDGNTLSFPYVANSFTQTSATFNLSSVTDGNYNIKLQVGY